MKRADAIARAEERRPDYEIPKDWAMLKVDRRIIELVEGETQKVVDQLPAPGAPYDLVAWLISFGEGPSYVELAVDDHTGRIVRVRRSR